MKCKQCGNEMQLVDMPQAIFIIPFTKGRFAIWDWNKKGWYCVFCAEESEEKRQADIEDSISNSIGQEAYEEGFRDGQNAPVGGRR